jgi:hypothetical protein
MSEISKYTKFASIKSKAEDSIRHSLKCNDNICSGLEVSTAVIVNSTLFWNVTSCSQV